MQIGRYMQNICQFFFKILMWDKGLGTYHFFKKRIWNVHGDYIAKSICK